MLSAFGIALQLLERNNSQLQASVLKINSDECDEMAQHGSTLTHVSTSVKPSSSQDETPQAQGSSTSTHSDNKAPGGPSVEFKNNSNNDRSVEMLYFWYGHYCCSHCK